MAELSEDIQRLPKTTRPNKLDRIVSSGLNLITDLERDLCGPGLTSSLAQAEGMAMTGIRTAVAPHPCRAAVDLRALPVVLQVVTQANSLDLPEAPLQFIASTHQEAADLTLAAHLLTDRIQAPVVMAMDESVAGNLGAIQLLEQDALAALLAVSQPSGITEDRDLKDQNWINLQVQECLELVSQATGRPIVIAKARTGSKCRRIILSSGSLAALLTHLDSPSGEIGTLGVSVIRPFPSETVADLVPAGTEVFVLRQAGCAVDEALENAVRKGMDCGEIRASGITTLLLDLVPESSTALAAHLNQVLPGADLRIAARASQPPVTPCLSVSPAGSWAREILGLVASLNRDESLNIAEESGYSVLTSGNGSELDGLVIIQTGFSYPDEAIQKVKRGGQVLYLSPDRNAATALSWIRSSDLDLLEEREVELWWVSCPSGREVLPSDVAELVFAIRSQEGGQGTGIVFTGSSAEAPRPFQLERLDTVKLRPLLTGADAIFETQIELPVLMDDDPADQERWQNGLREFHLTGHTDLRQASLSPDVPLLPAACRELSKSGLFQREFPLFLADSVTSAASLDSVLRQAIQEGEEDGADFSILKGQIRTILELVDSLAEGDLFQIEKVHEALDQCLEEFDVSDHGKAKLSQETRALKEILPPSGTLVRFSPTAWLPLLVWAVQSGRAASRKHLLSEARTLVLELENILKADRGISDQAHSPDVLSSAIGESGLIDAAALSAVIPKSRGPLGLSEERRSRISSAKQTLDELLKALEEMPLLYTVSSLPLDLAENSGIESITHPEPFLVALGLYDGTLKKSLAAFKAMRVARLETTGDYSAEAHDAILKRFSWEACSVDELLALPAVVVCESADRLTAKSLGDFNRVLHSGRPIQILITNPHPSLDDLLGQPTDIGYLGLAHRESYVLQSSFAAPDHLVKGLIEMSTIIRPAVAVLALPDPEATSWEWRRSIVSQYSRSTPVFSYNPSLGDTWADCFSLEGNPEPASTWLLYEIKYSEADGSLGSIGDRLTFAHFAALDPHFRRHFLTLPSEAWGEELVPLSEYLEQYRNTPPSGIPFIWVLDEHYGLQRAALTREMAEACRNRQRAWRILQELAGLNNRYVEDAVKKVKAETTAAAEESQAAALERARAEGAAVAVDRLVAILTDPASVQSLVPTPPPIQKAVAAPSTSAEPSAVTVIPDSGIVESKVEEGEEEEVVLEEAYIDSFLCSSCNDCINLNPLMFKYNQDKQAYIADIAAGTYAQLVKAAEGCPASCIHPGAPRPGDETASEALVERAKAFQ